MHIKEFKNNQTNDNNEVFSFFDQEKNEKESIENKMVIMNNNINVFDFEGADAE